MITFFKLYTPEIFLTFSVISLLIYNSYIINFFKFPVLNLEILFQIFTITFITFFLFTNVSFFSFEEIFFFNTFQTQNLKILIMVIFLNLFLLIWKGFYIQKLNFFEYFIILLLSLLGIFFLINSYNLISIYLCLEIQALGFYILASFDRTSLFSSEAGLKYFISSSLISGIFLFGSALIYISLGTLNLYEILILTSYFYDFTFYDFTLNFSLFFFMLGAFLILNCLLFKLVIAPFHFWFPQIYDGSPISSLIVFSILPKIVIINLFINFWSSFYKILFFSDTYFLIIGSFSVFFGLYKMLKQKRLKKLYIFSSISNFGLLLCVLLENTIESTLSVFFFVIIYTITSILFWLIFLFIYNNQLLNKANNSQFASLYITTFQNLYSQNKILAISICFIFFSLAAIPPFCGFFSKLYLFIVLLKNSKYELSLLLIYLGIFGSYYYIKFLKVICFENIKIKSLHQIKTFFPTIFLNLESTFFCFFNLILIYLFIYPHSLLHLLLFLI